MENNFGEFLKQKRLEKNLTQKQLSEILYVSEVPFFSLIASAVA